METKRSRVVGKALLAIFFLLFAFSLLFINQTSIIAYAEAPAEAESITETEDTSFEWNVWFQEKAMPILIAVGAGIITICSFLYPVLNSVNGGIKLFRKSKTDFDNTTQKVIETHMEITGFKDTSLVKLAEISENIKNEVGAIAIRSKEELDDIKSKTTAVLQAYEVILNKLAKQVGNIVKVAKIGFCNSSELVKNGYANEIMKVGVEDENSQVETTNCTDNDI